MSVSDRIKNIPYALPEIGEEEIREVEACLRSGWLTTGPKVKQFENEFCKFLGGSCEAIAVNSATAGLHLALEAIGISPQDEVITTNYTFTATAEVIRYFGAKPVFVDIDSDNLCIDIHSIESAITSHTKAIIPVHFAGHPANMNEILRLARKNNLKVIEDAAHAFPAKYKGIPIGRLESDATVFSFYANKTITTGEGGMLVTNNKRIADRARIMRLHGISHDVFDRFTGTSSNWYYEVVAPGFKYNMPDILASIGVVQLRNAQKFLDKRSVIADIYNNNFANSQIIRPPNVYNGDVHAWHIYIIQLDESLNITRDQFISKLSKHGIGSSVHYIPLHLHPYWRDTYNLKADMFPNSLRVFKRCISLPIYSKMTISDANYVASTVLDIIK